MLLEVAGLNKSFGSIIVADDLGLSVAPGEAVGIIGPNGAGKTTLFNLIAGSLAPASGSICLDGRDLIGEPAAPALPGRHRPHLADPAAVRKTDGVREPAGRRGLWPPQDRA